MSKAPVKAPIPPPNKSGKPDVVAPKVTTSAKTVVSQYTSGFDPSKYAKPGLSSDDVLRIKECFDIFDYDKSGAITPNELKNAIVALGLEKSAEEILLLVEDLDKDGNNEVEFEEFLQIFGFTGDISDEEVLKDLFTQFDVEGRGLLTANDFKRINDLVGERYTDGELREMVEYGDKDKDGFINFEEFRTVVLKTYNNV